MLRQQPLFNTQDDMAQKEYSAGEGFQAQLELQYRQVTSMSYARKEAVEELQNKGEKLPPEQINKEFNINASEPLTRGAAFYISGEQEEVRKLNEIVQNGPRTFLGGTVAPFMGGIVGALAGPVDFGVGWAVGGIFSWAAKAIKGYNAGMAIKAVELGRGSAFAADAIGNIVSNGVTEAFNYRATKSEQMEMAADEIFTNVVGASLAFTGAIHGTGAVISKLFKMGPTTVGAVDNVASTSAINSKDMSTVVPKIVDALQKDVDIDDTLVSALRATFPETYAKYIDGAEDVMDIRNNLLKDEVSPEIYQTFFNNLEDSGYDMRKAYLFDDDIKPRLSDETIVDIEKTLSDEKNDYGYNTKADEDVTITEDFDMEMDAEYQRLQKYDSVQIMDDEVAQLDLMAKKNLESAKNEVEAAKSFFECMGLTL